MQRIPIPIYARKPWKSEDVQVHELPSNSRADLKTKRLTIRDPAFVSSLSVSSLSDLRIVSRREKSKGTEEGNRSVGLVRSKPIGFGPDRQRTRRKRRARARRGEGGVGTVVPVERAGDVQIGHSGSPAIQSPARRRKTSDRRDRETEL